MVVVQTQVYQLIQEALAVVVVEVQIVLLLIQTKAQLIPVVAEEVHPLLQLDHPDLPRVQVPAQVQVRAQDQAQAQAQGLEVDQQEIPLA